MTPIQHTNTIRWKDQSYDISFVQDRLRNLVIADYMDVDQSWGWYGKPQYFGGSFYDAIQEVYIDGVKKDKSIFYPNYTLDDKAHHIEYIVKDDVTTLQFTYNTLITLTSVELYGNFDTIDSYGFAHAYNLQSFK